MEEELGNRGGRRRTWDDEFVLKRQFSALVPAFDPRPGRTNVQQTQDVEIPPPGVRTSRYLLTAVLVCSSLFMGACDVNEHIVLLRQCFCNRSFLVCQGSPETSFAEEIPSTPQPRLALTIRGPVAPGVCTVLLAPHTRAPHPRATLGQGTGP